MNKYDAKSYLRFKEREQLSSPGVPWLTYATDDVRHADNIETYAREAGHEVVYPYQTDGDYPQILYIRCTADQLEAMEARSLRFHGHPQWRNRMAVN